MTSIPETEHYIRFQLEQLSVRNEHHAFESICFRVAERRLSSNLLPATGPVSAGGDQGRDAETYYTRLPEELPGAGGFVGRATTEPLVVACTVQRSGLEAKIRGDVKSICEKGEPVARVAYFAAQDVPVAIRHRLQEQAREKHRVTLEIFDGLAISTMLAQGDLVWVAQSYLDLPSALVPPHPDSPQPDWYVATLDALRSRDAPRLTPGALSEVRDGLRHATFDAEAMVDLPEWLRYMREFVDRAGDDDLVSRARYECAVATIRGLGTVDGVEDDIRAVLAHALSTEVTSMLDDASVLLMYWGAACARCLSTVTANELRDWNLRLRGRAIALLDATDRRTYPHRTAALLAVAAHLCLHPRWPDMPRPPASTLASYREITLLRREMADAGETIVMDRADVDLDVSEAMEHLAELIELLRQAPAFAFGSLAEIFQMLTPALVDDPRYAKVRDGFDAAVARVEGDDALASRARTRAASFLRAERHLDALRELHEAKINWWHGDTLRDSLRVMCLISNIYGQLELMYAAKQYALAAASIATAHAELADLVPVALMLAAHHSYDAGAWGDSVALAGIAALAHGVLAEEAFDYDAHPQLAAMEFHTSMAVMATAGFRAEASEALAQALDGGGYRQLIEETVGQIKSSFTPDETQFATLVREQLSGEPWMDFGPRRTIRFALLGTTWSVTCRNNRSAVLAAERFASAVQVVLVELEPSDPVLLPQNVLVEITTGTLLKGRDRVRMRPNNDALDCMVVLSDYTSDVDPESFGAEVTSAVVYLLGHINLRPFQEFMGDVENTFATGLLHKLHMGRPYDEIAGLLGEAHYESLATVSLAPLPAQPTVVEPATALEPRATPGRGYDREKSLGFIKENYEFLPDLLNQTLPRALADPATRAELQRLRDEGWLDWQMLVAISNAAFNVRAHAAGLLHQPPFSPVEKRQQHELAHERETERSLPIPLSEITAEPLRFGMEIGLFAIAQRRWKLGSPVQTPDQASLRALLIARYGFASDDVLHRDLLHDVLQDDGNCLQLMPAEATGT